MNKSNLNKKRIAIVTCILLLVLFSIISIQAFSFRKTQKNTYFGYSNPSLEAIQYIVSSLNYQLEINAMGRGSGIFIVYSVGSTNGFMVRSILYRSDITPTFTFSGNNVTINFEASCYQYSWNDETGFYEEGSTSSLMVNKFNVFYCSSEFPSSDGLNGFTGPNLNANFGQDSFNSYNVYQYYSYIYDSAVNREERESTIRQEAQSEGYSEGFDFGVENGYRLGFDEGEEEGYSEGYSEGESVGYSSGHRDGFEEGRDEGYTFGFDEGYSEGESVGYSSGHQDGYDEGYSEGYSDGYETGYNIVYDDLQQPGTIEAIFTTKDSSGNTLYLAQEADIENLDINYAFVPKDQLSDSFIGYRLYVKTYDVTKYLQDNPLDYDYPLPVLEDNGIDYLALYRKVNVTREYFDLYSIYSFVEVTIDQSFIDQLANQYNEGLNDANALVNGIGDIATKPITSLKDALNFEIFGLNIGVVAVGIVAILFAIWAYNKIRKVLPI